MRSSRSSGWAARWLVIRMIKTGNGRLWIWFGVLAGIGLENKYSMLIFGAGLVAGLILTPERRILASGWVWGGGAIAFLLFAPNLIDSFNKYFTAKEAPVSPRRWRRKLRTESWKY